jgi:stage VI sporulation protein D
MLEQLRFNISEKIRLHPQQAGISSLLELDLYPDVEIKEEGQHVKIHGYLRLNGTYEGEFYDEDDGEYEDELDGEAIAYVIPVEITLPRERAQLVDVSAEVESFDYQLLSPFELQIEAVLLIDGILPEQEEPELITEISEEEASMDESPSFAAQSAQSQLEEPTTTIDENIEKAEEKLEERGEEVEVPIVEKQEEPVLEEAKLEEVDSVAVEVEVPPVTTEEELNEASIPSSCWSSWLVSGQDEHFVPMKMVIVQPDDSIDTLAAKYEISSDDIIRTNQFVTDRLVAGQIVKIPVKQS